MLHDGGDISGQADVVSIVKKRSKNFSPKNKKDLGMACHTPSPLQKSKKQEEMPLPSLCTIHLKNVKFRNGWERGWVMTIL